MLPGMGYSDDPPRRTLWWKFRDRYPIDCGHLIFNPLGDPVPCLSRYVYLWSTYFTRYCFNILPFATLYPVGPFPLQGTNANSVAPPSLE
jgi:hypothetical protein